MADSPEIESEAAAYRFLLRFMEDQEQGRNLTVEEYQDLFPRHRELIASRFEELRAARASNAAFASGPVPLTVPERIGRFRILHQIGRGGQGNVFLARDEELGRDVALKLLSLSGLLAPESVKRFHREAEVASRLDHSGICTVYEAGEHDGVFYIAMQHVEGVTLSERIEASRRDEGDSLVRLGDRSRRTTDSDTPRSPGPMAEVLRFFEETARALHAAHELGLVHRDIKPQNLMVTPERRPVILDFGLARDLESDAPTLTRTGDLMGTPHYIAPEQLAGSATSVDRQADVYSLGITLYESLTLRRPYDGPSRESLFKKILEADLPDPRSVSPRISRDLAVVLQTSLDRDRNRRYHTALELAEELRRVRRLEPIHARPASQWIQLRRWSQRNPVLASATVGILVLLTAGLIASLLFIRVLSESERHSRALALVGQSSEVADRDDLHSLVLARRAVGVEQNVATVSQLHAALGEMRESARYEAHGEQVVSVEFSRDGARFLTAGGNRVKLMDGEGRMLSDLPAENWLSSACFSPDGASIVASSQRGTVGLWDLGDDRRWNDGEDRYRLAEKDRESGDKVWYAGFSPDGEEIVSCSNGGAVRIWNRDLVEICALPHPAAVYHAEFSPVEDLLVTSCGDGAVRIFERVDGSWDLRTTIEAHDGPVWRATFSPDGTRILSFSSTGGYLAVPHTTDFTAHLWGHDGERLQHHTHRGRVHDARFSPDGRHAITTSGAGELLLWNLKERTCLPLALDRARVFRACRFSPDGDRILLTGSAGVVRLLDLVGNVQADLHGHRRWVFEGTFSPDGRSVVTGGFDNTARLWRPFTEDPVRVPLTGNLDSRIAVNPRYEVIALTSGRGVIELRDGRGELVRELVPDFEPGGELFEVHWDRSGDRVLARYKSGEVVVWEQGGAVLGTFTVPEGQIGGLVVFTPDPDEVLVCGTGRAWLGSIDGRVVPVPLGAVSDLIKGADYHPNGELVVTAGWDGHVRLFTADWGELLWHDPHGKRLNDAVFSPNGERILVSCDDGAATLYDLTGKRLQCLKAGEETIQSVRFSRDGRFVLLCGSNGMAQVWAEEDEFRLKAFLRGHRGQVWGDFLPSGARIVTVARDNLLRFWEVATDAAIELADERIARFPPEVLKVYETPLAD